MFRNTITYTIRILHLLRLCTCTYIIHKYFIYTIHTYWIYKVEKPKKGCASFYVSWNIMRKVASARPTQTNSSKMLLPQYTKRRRPNLSFFVFSYTPLFIIISVCDVRGYIYRCRVEARLVWWRERFFFLARKLVLHKPRAHRCTL